MKFSTINTCFLFIVLLHFACTNSMDPEDPNHNDPDPVIQQDIIKVDERVESFMSLYNIPGASIAISKQEQMIYTKGYGMADTLSKQPVQINSVFRVASISKMFTGVCILKLVEEGQLQLDDRVFGPEGILGDQFGTATLTDQEEQITIDHLLHNSFGGWGVATGGDPIDYFPEYNEDQFLEYLLKEWDLTYPIEDTYVYSNTGYWLLARIVEKVSGTIFSEYCKSLFEQAEISTLHYTQFRQDDRQANEVEYYGQDGEEQYVYSIASRRDGDAGVVISAPDLLRAVCALDKLEKRTDVLSASSIELLRGNGPLSPNWGRGIGFWNEQGYWWTTGALPATRSWLNATYEGFNIVIIFNSKSNSSNFDSDLNQMLFDILNDSSIDWQEDLDQF